MRVNITTRHLNDRNKSKKLREYAQKKIPRIERYMHTKYDPTEIKLIFEAEKRNNIAEIIINDGDFQTTASVIDDDHFAAIDKVIDRIIKQLKRNWEKRSSSKRKHLKTNIPKTSTIKSKRNTDKIMDEKLPLKPMSLNEAKLQLEITPSKFIAFRNSENGEMNVLYRNNISALKLIIP
jgi:putative sigma-54 modulation protein